jgi:hypothetical protein
MNTNQNNYQLLIDKLDAFIRKYYKNQLIRGLIYSFTSCLLFFLAVTALEYFAHFSTLIRTILFYGFVISAAYILGAYIFIPLFHLYRLGKIISHEQAAGIIGEHFGNVKDKLLNTLQLRRQAEENQSQAGLIMASIDQRIAELKPVPFTSAIDLNKNKRHLRYAIIPVLCLVVVIFTAPSLLTDGTTRLIRHSTYFEKPAPFTFEIINKELKTVQLSDFELSVKLNGTEIPENVYISYNNTQYKLTRENTVTFNYTFKNVQQDIPFNLVADGYSSKAYELKALPNPLILNFDISLTYPAYLGKPSEKLNNTGDLIVPAGTIARWNFNTRNTRVLKMNFRDTVLQPAEGNNNFNAGKKLLVSNQYSIVTANQFMRNKDSMQYSITVIPDLYPTLQVEQQVDSVASSQIYFKGLAKDDYGFSRLNFTYHFINTSDSLERIQKTFTENIQVQRNINQAQFFYFLDVSKLMILPGDEFEYYFEVWDNDGVNGPKSTRSQTLIYKAPSLKEIAENTEKNNKELKNDLNESIEKAKKIQKDVNDAARRLLEKKNLDFDDKKKIEDLLRQQKELEKKVAEMQKQNEKNNATQQEFQKFDPAIAEKHKQLEDLFNKVMNDDMKNLMKELEKLLSEFDKQKAQEMLEKMKLNNKDLEKELDRTLELFKALEVEQKMNEAIKNLDDLSKEQEKLAEKSDDNKSDSKDLKDQQNDLNKKFDDLQKDLKDIENKNKELEFPKDMESTEPEQQDIDKDMQESEQQLGENKKSKASKSQKSAADKMQKMSQKMKQQQEQEEMEQQEEDMASLRYLLENLIQFSFDQEALMQELKTMDVNNPKYLKLSQQQRKLKDDSGILEDSLFALSKRVPQISSVVNKEISLINDNIGDAINHLQDRMVAQARSDQQYVMTSTNNLALLLNEAMDQMQQQMKNQKPGNKSCKKPGKGKPNPSAAQMKKMQEALNEQLKEAREAMKKGKKPGEKPGGESGMSEQLARMAAQQEAIRNELQKYNQQENKDGGNKLGDLGKLANDMEETEKDIVNKRITEETLKRQQDILTRLLEAEKAERERDQEEKRQANENKTDIYRNPPQFEEYKRLKMQEVELLKTIPPSLTPFYKNLVNYYFQNIDN